MKDHKLKEYTEIEYIKKEVNDSKILFLKKTPNYRRNKKVR